MTTRTRLDLIDAIVDDHREVLRVFDELEQGTGDPQRRRDLTDHVITQLVRHSVSEEMYMYPVARRMLPDGEQVVDHDLDEHAEATELMKRVEGLDSTTPEFEELLQTLMSDVRHHLEDEETDLLPRLRNACDEAELEDLGEKFVRAKRIAPTRPHPSAPETPPANLVLAPGAGLIDRLRDALESRNF